jgi:glycosidase
MGVDGFRIDTGKHISRLVFNKVFNDAFHAAAQAAGKPNFFMFSEICTRDRNY